MNRFTRYLVIMMFVCIGAGKLSACVTDSSNFAAYYRGDGNDLNDSGALTLDADDPNCAHAAANRLVAKLIDTPTSYFQQSLAGYNIALIFAAAVRLGSYGWFNTQPDPYNSLTYQLDRIKNNYVEVSHAGGCGTGFEGNSCMDDYAGEAAAWGWMAAYKKNRGDSDTWLAAQTSGDRIDSFFNNVCIFDQANYDAGDHRICNGTWYDIEDGTGYVFAFEHGFESPHYAFGLLTSIDMAIVGLEASGAGKTLSTEQQSKVFGMWAEIQRHIGNWYGQECKHPIAQGNGQFTFDTNISCADFGYDPSMYNLRDFLINHGNFTPPFDQYQANGGHNWDAVSNPFTDAFGYGRRVTYKEQPSDWYVNRGNQYSTRYMPFNNNGAQGYLDAVSDSGVAYGWACDADQPTGTVKVDFYVGNTLLAEDPSQFPNTGSEPAVNSLCGGGSAHRFFVQLPAWAQGQPIYAVARDYTTGSLVNLTCLEAQVCSW